LVAGGKIGHIFQVAKIFRQKPSGPDLSVGRGIGTLYFFEDYPGVFEKGLCRIE
jgi:hypothetical protein